MVRTHHMCIYGSEQRHRPPLWLGSCSLVSIFLELKLNNILAPSRRSYGAGNPGNGIKKIGSFSNDDCDGSENVPIKINSRFFLLALDADCG